MSYLIPHLPWRDRYIPLRKLQANLFDIDQDNEEDEVNNNHAKNGRFINLAKIRFLKNNYKKALHSVLLPNNLRLLNFFPPSNNKNKYPFYEQDWPVKPRKRPLIGPPQAIVDMPIINSILNYIDWSSTGWLAVLCENEVHVWYPSEKKSTIVTDTNKRVKYLKWNSKGTKLVLGLSDHKIGIWDFALKKISNEIPCCENISDISSYDYNDDVISLKWIKNKIVTVCGLGMLHLRTSNLKLINSVYIGNNLPSVDLVNMAISCNERYIAVNIYSDAPKKTKVKIIKPSSLEILREIDFMDLIFTLDWHPWKESLLALGASKLVLWNVNNGEIMKSESIDCIDVVKFHPLTGELVISYYNQNGNEKCYYIGVLANLKTKVEELYIHAGHVMQLLWSPKYDQLASVSCDETICIWDFFGPNFNKGFSSKLRNPRKRNSALTLMF